MAEHPLDTDTRRQSSTQSTMRRPHIIRWVIHSERLNRIVDDITDHRPVVRPIMNNMILIPTFENCAGPLIPPVEIPRIAPIQPHHESIEGNILHFDQKMIVIIHDHIAENAHTQLPNASGEHPHKTIFVRRIQEDAISIVSSYQHVVDATNLVDRFSWAHALLLSGLTMNNVAQSLFASNHAIHGIFHSGMMFTRWPFLVNPHGPWHLEHGSLHTYSPL